MQIPYSREGISRKVGTIAIKPMGLFPVPSRHLAHRQGLNPTRLQSIVITSEPSKSNLFSLFLPPIPRMNAQKADNLTPGVWPGLCVMYERAAMISGGFNKYVLNSARRATEDLCLGLVESGIHCCWMLNTVG